MTSIPRPALFLGLAGVLPFAASAIAGWMSPITVFFGGWDAILFAYGLTILSFMSGCIWAFSAKADDAIGYALSTLPALFGLAFLGLLLLDRRAFLLGQTPDWWMRLRLLLTGLVILSLAIGILT